jgi:hypothetical protein
VHDDAVGQLDRTVSVVSTICELTSMRQVPAGGGRPEDESGARPVPPRTDQRASPGVDGSGLPLALVVTAGNAGDRTAFGQVLDGIKAAPTSGVMLP